MLSHSQKTRISNPYYNENYVTIYWNQLQQSDNITEKQWQLLLVLAEMPKKQQLKYVIIEDQLIEAPTKVKHYSKVPSTGEWQRNLRMSGNNRYDK